MEKAMRAARFAGTAGVGERDIDGSALDAYLRHSLDGFGEPARNSANSEGGNPTPPICSRRPIAATSCVGARAACPNMLGTPSTASIGS